MLEERTLCESSSRQIKPVRLGRDQRDFYPKRRSYAKRAFKTDGAAH